MPGDLSHGGEGVGVGEYIDRRVRNSLASQPALRVDAPGTASFDIENHPLFIDPHLFACQFLVREAEYSALMARSSSWLGHSPLKAGARVRIPYALPSHFYSVKPADWLK